MGEEFFRKRKIVNYPIDEILDEGESNIDENMDDIKLFIEKKKEAGGKEILKENSTESDPEVYFPVKVDKLTEKELMICPYEVQWGSSDGGHKWIKREWVGEIHGWHDYCPKCRIHRLFKTIGYVALIKNGCCPKCDKESKDYAEAIKKLLDEGKGFLIYEHNPKFRDF